MPNLPDLDMAVNIIDESRILTPRETIEKYIRIEQERRELVAPELAITSPSRNRSAVESFNGPVEYPSWQMPYTYRGFIQNFTQARDPCLQPHLRGLQGTFVESVSMSTTTTLFPLFAGSKLPTNNELLIPAA
ncbi:hypothetical protein LLEC1_04196, partial [Akanthomyces lecanii]